MFTRLVSGITPNALAGAIVATLIAILTVAVLPAAHAAQIKGIRTWQVGAAPCDHQCSVPWALNSLPSTIPQQAIQQWRQAYMQHKPMQPVQVQSYDLFVAMAEAGPRMLVQPMLAPLNGPWPAKGYIATVNNKQWLFVVIQVCKNPAVIVRDPTVPVSLIASVTLQPSVEPSEHDPITTAAPVGDYYTMGWYPSHVPPRGHNTYLPPFPYCCTYAPGNTSNPNSPDNPHEGGRPYKPGSPNDSHKPHDPPPVVAVVAPSVSWMFALAVIGVLTFHTRKQTAPRRAKNVN